MDQRNALSKTGPTGEAARLPRLPQTCIYVCFGVSMRLSGALGAFGDFGIIECIVYTPCFSQLWTVWHLSDISNSSKITLLVEILESKTSALQCSHTRCTAWLMYTQKCAHNKSARKIQQTYTYKAASSAFCTTQAAVQCSVCLTLLLPTWPDVQHQITYLTSMMIISVKYFTIYVLIIMNSTICISRQL